VSPPAPDRRATLRAALGFLALEPRAPELQLLHRCFDGYGGTAGENDLRYPGGGAVLVTPCHMCPVLARSAYDDRMTRSDWLLAFLAAAPADRLGPDFLDAAASLDPIRIQKGLFLFQQQDATETPALLQQPPYEFEPYAYGPFAQSIYVDLEQLHRFGLVDQFPVAGQKYSRWQLTEDGRSRVEELVANGEIPAQVVPRLRRAKKIVVSQPFADLLRYVYGRYPQYASESVAKL
jgi:hypothetical protein